jgi:hypothetical protein
MKNKKFLLSAIFLFSVMVSFAQNEKIGASVPMPISELKSGIITKGSMNAIVEPANTVLSYLPENSSNGYTSDEKAGYQCFQYFSGATGSFEKVTIWAVNSSYTNPVTFELTVEVYSGSETETTLGTTAVPLSTTTATVVPEETGEMFGTYNIYSYSVLIPTTALSEGWISVRSTTTAAETFYWLNTTAAPANSCYQHDNAVWPEGLSLSLSSVDVVPVSIWVVLFAFILMVAAVVFRYRRSLSV